MFQIHTGGIDYKEGEYLMILKKWMIPFLIALGGVLSDYVTTTYGLNFCTGLYETHPQYSPVWAILIFWGSLAILTIALPRRKPWILSINSIALISYLGAINNILVISGIFSGLVI